MAITKLQKLKDYCKKIKGIDIHGNSIRMSFYYKKVRCIEVFSGMKLSQNNIDFVTNKRAVILHEIAMQKFNYAEHFPNSKKVFVFNPNIKKIPLIKDAGIQWLKCIKNERTYSTFLCYQNDFRFSIIQKWGERVMDSISRSEIKEWIQTELFRLASKTINNILIVFRGIYKLVIADEIITHDPLKYISNLPIIKQEPDPFTKAEINRIHETKTPRVQEINSLIFCCWAGLRQSELISIAWEDVDFENWTIKIRRSKVLNRYKATKTRGSERKIHLLGPAIEILKSQMQYSFGKAPINVKVLLYDNKTIRNESLRFIFLNSLTLEPILNAKMLSSKFYKEHLTNANVRYRPPKQARHTFGSQLITAGAPERWISQQMGHNSLNMLESHYGKWMSEEVPDMAERVTKLLGFSNYPIHGGSK